MITLLLRARYIYGSFFCLVIVHSFIARDCRIVCERQCRKEETKETKDLKIDPEIFNNCNIIHYNNTKGTDLLSTKLLFLRFAESVDLARPTR